MPTWTSQKNDSTSESCGLHILSTSAPYKAMSRPSAAPAMTWPIPNARMPASGRLSLFALSGTGSLSPIFSTVISGIFERTSMYWGSRRNSSFVRTIARTIPSSAAAFSNSTAFHLPIALEMDSLLALAPRKLRLRARGARIKIQGHDVSSVSCFPEEMMFHVVEDRTDGVATGRWRRPLIVSHFPSKNPANRRSALRTSTEISCPSPLVCLQSAASATLLAARPIAAMRPEADRARENRIASGKRELASGVRGC